MSKYIVERGNHQPRILVRGDDGTYSVLTHGTGDNSIDDLLEIAELANDRYEEGNR